MSLPKPNNDEARNAFMVRFMADEDTQREFQDERRRYEAGVSAWDQVHPVQRKIALGTSELRLDDGEAPKLTGYAAKYGIKTDLGWFIEKIRAGAFDEALETSDVRALKNHNPDLLLGRTSSGTLRLASNTVGLRFEVDTPDTTTGRDTIEEVRRGDLAGCSFSFTVAEDEWRHFEDKSSERTIVKIAQLFDVGPVTFPAYEETSVAVRSLEQFQQAQKDTTDAPPAETPPVKNEITPARRMESDRLYERITRKVNRQRASEDAPPAPGQRPGVD